MFWIIVALVYIVTLVLVLSLFAINKPEDEDMKSITYVGAPLRDLLLEGPRVLQTVAPLYFPFQIPPTSTLEERNEIKRQKAIAWLGTRWILHPENKVGRVGDV